jgi:hypothetical protein
MYTPAEPDLLQTHLIMLSSLIHRSNTMYREIPPAQ